eukprot:gene12572-14416_t
MSCNRNCGVCLGEVNDPVQLCAVCDEAFCRACLAQYIESLVYGAFHGSCPSITCPSLSHSRKTVLPISQWALIVSETVVSTYHDLASELLSMRCGECHQTSSHLVSYDPSVSCEFLLSTGHPETADQEMAHFRANMALFCTGDMNIDDFYQAVVHEHFPVLLSNDDEAAWRIFYVLLRSIEEPERRCNLQLRYYRDRPCMHTLCCCAEHCFQCAVYNFHHGQTCMEVRDAFDNTMIECPVCNISLVKSEGCDTIECVCGSVMNWADELYRVDECQRFLQMYPAQPSAECARILCTIANQFTADAVEVLLAKAWQEHNPIDVNRALVDWFRVRFAPCPSQACLTLIEAEQTEGVVQAMALWRAEHATDVARCKAQNDRAVASLFLTMQPRAADRAMAARRFINSKAGTLPGNRQMQRSVELWIETHREEYDRGVAEWQQRSAQQLVLRFGSYSLPHMRPLEVHPSGRNAISMAHFVSLCDGMDISIFATTVPFNARNRARWTKLVAELDELVG